MKIVRPAPINDATLTSSNVPENEYASYSLGTTYGIGDRVISSHKIYQSLAAGNRANPVTDETKWLYVGPTNRWAMFDTVNTTVTTAANIDVYVYVPGGRADGLALFNLSATSVRVTVDTVAAGTIYDKTYSLVSTAGITSWYDYFFDPIAYKTDLVLTDLPLNVNPTVRVRITSTTGSVSCGTMTLGQIADIGGTIYGVKAGIQDFSKKEADTFGNYEVVPRAYAKRIVARLTLDNDQIDSVFQTLANLRTTPCVWIGVDAYASTATLGFWKDFAIEIPYPTKSIVSLEIEGLT